jgi:hypothetical protein
LFTFKELSQLLIFHLVLPGHDACRTQAVAAVRRWRRWSRLGLFREKLLCEPPIALNVALQRGGVLAPDKPLSWRLTTVMGVEHAVAMFGATVLAPILMSGMGTLIFFCDDRRQTKLRPR